MTKTDDLRNKDLSQSRDFQILPTRNCKESTEIPMSSTILELSEDEYEQRMQAAVEKALKKQATAAEVDALRRIETAKAQALQSVKRSTSLFHSFVPTEELSEILENDPVHSDDDGC